MNRIQQYKYIKTLITESFFFFFSLQVPESKMEDKQTADVDLHVKAYKCGENRKHTMKTDLHLCDRTDPKGRTKNNALCGMLWLPTLLPKGSCCRVPRWTWPLLCCLKQVGTRPAEFILRPLWSVHREVSGPAVRKVVRQVCLLMKMWQKITPNFD